MDELEILYKSRLTQIRVARVSAQRLKVGTKSGNMGVQCKFGVSSSSAKEKLMGKVELEVEDVPEEEGQQEPAFKFSIEVRGILTFDNPVDEKDIRNNKDLTAALCQPMYLFAMKRAEAILGDLGVRGIRLDTDIRMVVDEDETSEASSEADSEAEKS